MPALRRSASNRAVASRASVARTAQQRVSKQRAERSRSGSGRVVVGSSGAPMGAIEAMQQAYLLAVRETHAQFVGSIQDASSSGGGGFWKRVFSWVNRAVLSIKSSVDEDLHKLPILQPSKLAGSATLVKSFEKRNVDLIKQVAAEHRAKLQDALAATEGQHVKARAAALQETLQVSESKAKFWAVDQTLKLHADVVETQHKRLGIVEYVWRTSQDGTVRDDHAKLNTKTFRYDSPPVTNASEVARGRPERRCNPGKDYRCRCHADPVLPE